MAAAAWLSAGLLEVLPVQYSALGGLFRRRVIPADVVQVTVAPSDADGRYALGLADEYLCAALDCARVVLAEVSPSVPRIAGARNPRRARNRADAGIVVTQFGAADLRSLGLAAR